jgi:hypothetical protein
LLSTPAHLQGCHKPDSGSQSILRKLSLVSVSYRKPVDHIGLAKLTWPRMKFVISQAQPRCIPSSTATWCIVNPLTCQKLTHMRLKIEGSSSIEEKGGNGEGTYYCSAHMRPICNTEFLPAGSAVFTLCLRNLRLCSKCNLRDTAYSARTFSHFTFVKSMMGIGQDFPNGGQGFVKLQSFRGIRACLGAHHCTNLAYRHDYKKIVLMFAANYMDL